MRIKILSTAKWIQDEPGGPYLTIGQEYEVHTWSTGESYVIANDGFAFHTGEDDPEVAYEIVEF